MVGCGVVTSLREYTSSFASKLFAVSYVMLGVTRYGVVMLVEKP